MPPSGSHSGAARPLPLGHHAPAPPRPMPKGAIAGEIRPCVPREREPHAAGDGRDVPDDYWAAGVDVLILRTADRLHCAGADVPELQLRRVAEEVVLDAARFVLDWVEAPRTAAPPPAVATRGAPMPAVARSRGRR